MPYLKSRAVRKTDGTEDIRSQPEETNEAKSMEERHTGFVLLENVGVVDAGPFPGEHRSNFPGSRT